MPAGLTWQLGNGYCEGDETSASFKDAKQRPTALPRSSGATAATDGNEIVVTTVTSPRSSAGNFPV